MMYWNSRKRSPLALAAALILVTTPSLSHAQDHHTPHLQKANADAEAQFLQADALRRSHNIDAARIQLQHYLDKVPGSVKGWRMLAELCRIQQDYPAGVFAIEQAIRLSDNSSAKTFLNRAYLQLKAGEKVNRILLGLDQALIHFPRHAEILDRAMTLSRTNQKWERAEYYWQQVPDSARHQPNWLAQRKQLDAARNQYGHTEQYTREALSKWYVVPADGSQQAASKAQSDHQKPVLIAKD